MAARTLISTSNLAAAPQPRPAATLAELAGRGEDPNILEHGALLRSAAPGEVAALLRGSNRFIKALAIRELLNRRDRSQRDEIQRLFHASRSTERDLRFDPHVIPSASAAVLYATAEYLAELDGESAVSLLLGRDEYWKAPQYFTQATRHFPPGWIGRARALASDRSRQQSLAYLVAVSAQDGNVGELLPILVEGRQPLWGGALLACERLKARACWPVLENQLIGRSPAERLTARIGEYRAGAVAEAVLFDAALTAAVHAGALPAASDRVATLLVLLDFLGMCRERKMTPPPAVEQRLRATRSDRIDAEVRRIYGR